MRTGLRIFAVVHTVIISKMKLQHLLLVSLVLAPFTACSNDTEPPPPSEAGRIVQVHFDGSFDQGTATGLTYVADRKGKNPGAAHFDGSASAFIPSSDQYNFGDTVDFSVSLWMKALRSQTPYAGLVSKGTVGSLKGFQLTCSGAMADLQLEGAKGSLEIIGKKIITDSQWHHVALVVDRDSMTATIYVDGAVDKTAKSIAVQSDLSNTNAIFIGLDRNSTSHFVGDLDDVRIYRRALTAADIQSLSSDR